MDSHTHSSTAHLSCHTGPPQELEQDGVAVYATRAMCHRAPKDAFPAHGLPSAVAFQLIQDELNLDGNPMMNLASFVTTYMEPEAEALMATAMRKNFIDIDEYSQTAELQNRCVNMLAHLFHAPASEGVGTSTIGSSEAIMLAGLAMKWRWRDWKKGRGEAADQPNIVCGANVQVCWHKMCRYFEIECREADVSPDCLCLTAERARPLIDSNTIGVCAILGSTFNGEFEDVKAMHDMLEELNEENGWQVPIHVDAASGGFIAPFTAPDLVWDFRLPLVKSINVSGHKFGLVYAGIGWILFRERGDLPDGLVFHVNYLGGDQASFTLNFSKSAACIVAQYYQLVRLGHEGYKAIVENGMAAAAYLREGLVETGKFSVVDRAHMPLVAFSLKDSSKYTVFDLQDRLRGRGWIVPAYTCPSGACDLAIMRVVVKQNFSMDMADAHFDAHPAVRPDTSPSHEMPHGGAVERPTAAAHWSKGAVRRGKQWEAKGRCASLTRATR
eukprot:TRINITY_DN129_c0_g1_i5.p1 TRINITY_DN129_c0_g1~~TRINITY_DN129_c0_g1_i5.p1  ORF type:complete len:499 (+),score=164.85 TRINITY_DN129_c0_g1_i5:99-1595(+)